MGIYRKEMNSDTTIHNTSNHPMEQKTAAFRYYVNRLISLPLTQMEKVENGTIYLTWQRIMDFRRNKSQK